MLKKLLATIALIGALAAPTAVSAANITAKPQQPGRKPHRGLRDR
jgi:Ni/Co efflux regulator RcnB